MWSRSKKQEEEHFLLPSILYIPTLGEKKIQREPASRSLPDPTVHSGSVSWSVSPVSCTRNLHKLHLWDGPRRPSASSLLSLAAPGHQTSQFASSDWLLLLPSHIWSPRSHPGLTFKCISLLLIVCRPPWDHIHLWKTTVSIPFFIHSSEHNDWLIMKNSYIKRK